MKLRNRKTGKIVKLEVHTIAGKNYESLADVNKDWEDYKEQCWYITSTGEVREGIVDADWRDERRIGNYFETREDAVKALEKLEAFKRLKDKGFKFCGFAYTELCDYARVNIKATIINDSINEDLELLFGGK